MEKIRTKINELAKQINEEHGKVMASMRNALHHARKAGIILCQVRDSLRRGEWGPWVRRHFAGSPDTVERYMRIARDWDKLHAAEVADPNLSINQALRILRRTEEKENDPKQGKSGDKRFRLHLLTPDEARRRLVGAFSDLLNCWEDETVQCFAEFGLFQGRDFVGPIEERFDEVEEEIDNVAKPLMEAFEKAECRLSARPELTDKHLGELLASLEPLKAKRDSLPASARAIVDEAFGIFTQLRKREAKFPAESDNSPQLVF